MLSCVAHAVAMPVCCQLERGIATQQCCSTITKEEAKELSPAPATKPKLAGSRGVGQAQAKKDRNEVKSKAASCKAPTKGTEAERGAKLKQALPNRLRRASLPQANSLQRKPKAVPPKCCTCAECGGLGKDCCTAPQNTMAKSQTVHARALCQSESARKFSTVLPFWGGVQPSCHLSGQSNKTGQGRLVLPSIARGGSC